MRQFHTTSSDGSSSDKSLLVVLAETIRQTNYFIMLVTQQFLSVLSLSRDWVTSAVAGHQLIFLLLWDLRTLQSSLADCANSQVIS